MSIIKYNYNTDKHKYVGPHFQVIEFASFGNGKLYTNDVLIDSNLVNYLEDIFSKVHASKAIISSGYRNSECDKAVGGSGVGQHVNGRAADVCYYDKNGNIIPSKIIVCIAFDIGMPGTAVIDGNYSHLDTRTNGTYRGNESIGNSSYWSNPYSYFGVSKSDVARYTGESVTPSNGTTGTITYQAYANKWFSEVKGKTDFAGVLNRPISAFRCKPEYGTITYEAHILGGNWLGAVNSNNYSDGSENSYAGLFNKPIDGIRIKSSQGWVKYRVHILGGDWLPWAEGFGDTGNSFAGIYGKQIDAIQMY